jgi:tetratricopeptide (TPR) repeat protein
MYRHRQDSHHPFSQPSVTGRAALGSVAAVAAVVGIIVACGHGKVDQPPANGTIATGTSETAPAPTATTPTTPVVPTNVSYETAESAYAARQYPLAVTMFQAYTGRRPQNAWGYYMLGLSAWHAGQLDRAEQAFDTALAHDPRQVKSLVNLSRVLLEQNRPHDALDRINQALAIDSGLAESWRVLGRVQAHMGQTDPAVEAYRTAIKIDSSDVWSMNNLGLTLINAGRYADAVGPLARAVQLDSTVPAFGNNLGIALERSGHFTAATLAYKAVLSADSTYDKARVSLQRVDGRPDAVGTEPLDVTALAAEFAATRKDQ